MNRLRAIWFGTIGASGFINASAPAQNPPATATATTTGTSQSSGVRAPGSLEVALLQALRSDPATAPYPFSTEPRGSKILLRGRVGAKIIHDIAIRMAIDLGVPVEDGITIDTGFVPGGRPGYGPGRSGLPGASGAAVPPVLAFPSAGSYGGAPSLLPPPLFGRFDDPFYGIDPPAVVYPFWWGALNAQRQQANAGFEAGGAPGPSGFGPVGSINPATGAALVGSNPPNAASGPTGVPLNLNTTETDIGAIPDGTIDMEIDGSGVATIRGGVPSMAERVAIGQRVAGMAGVAQVVNLLTIKPALARRATTETPPPFPVPAEVAPTPKPPSNPPVIISTPTPPDPTNQPPTPTAPGIDPLSDGALTDRAARTLADRGATIGTTAKVKVRDGVASLSGKVASVYEAMLAYRAVQQTPGIRSIDDRLEFPVPDGSNGGNPLLEKGRPNDVEPYLEAQLRRQLGSLAHIDRVRLQVDALEIRGTLGRAEDRDRIDAILRSIPILRGFQLQTDLPVASP